MEATIVGVWSGRVSSVSAILLKHRAHQQDGNQCQGRTELHVSETKHSRYRLGWAWLSLFVFFTLSVIIFYTLLECQSFFFTYPNYLSKYLSSICFNFSLFINLSKNISMDLFIYLLNFLSTYVYLSIYSYISIYLSIYPSIYLSFCICVQLFICIPSLSILETLIRQELNSLKS